MAHVSHKLKNSFEGALAGGGDPATSPLYVFGPFLKLIVVAGVAKVTFGASIWLAVFTIAVVSAMYRLVMRWVTDGSGGSGLSEDEFGSWAVKVNAAITFIEYTLTFLVSMAAMVTFLADRLPWLNNKFLWFQYRTIVAIILSLLTGWLVNRGPKMAARTFGPATAGVLILLWVMIVSSISKNGFHLPTFNLEAFQPKYLNFTIGGYVRILAVMTGIEVFANLVAAYDGKPSEKSKKAFNSLLIIMGTTALTMLIVGPTIYQFADPTNEHVSVFTQTMDILLPDPFPLLGTIVGVAVLMSASAASSQGLQNLSLGMRRRNYIPQSLGQRNKFDVADKPVWIEVGIVCICFILFGTNEETYLALYAAGVFILLSMTGWAVTKRLAREFREEKKLTKMPLVFGTAIAAVLTTGATAIIFSERLLEGAWTYFLFIPALYALFTYSRKQLGEPTAEMDYLGQLDAAQLAGFGFGQVKTEIQPPKRRSIKPLKVEWQPAPIEESNWRNIHIKTDQIVVLLDGSFFAAQALPLAKQLSLDNGARLSLLSSVKDHTDALRAQYEDTRKARELYLRGVAKELKAEGIVVDYSVRPGFIAQATKSFVEEMGTDLIITSTRGKSGAQHWQTGGASSKLMNEVKIPVILVHSDARTENTKIKLDTILVALDGSINSEQVLPYARAYAEKYSSKLVLLTVPAVPEVDDYRAAADVVNTIRSKAEVNMTKFLQAVSKFLENDGLDVTTIVSGSIPTRKIVNVSEEVNADMVMITSRGRGGIDLMMVGSVAQRVVDNVHIPVLIMPIPE